MSNHAALAFTGLLFAVIGLGGSSGSSSDHVPSKSKLIDVFRVLINGRQVKGHVDPSTVTLFFDEFRLSCPRGCVRVQVQQGSFVDDFWIRGTSEELLSSVLPFKPMVKLSIQDEKGDSHQVHVSRGDIDAFGPSPVLSTSRKNRRGKIYMKNGRELDVTETVDSLRKMFSGRIQEIVETSRPF